jgi:hypothetical protein
MDWLLDDEDWRALQAAEFPILASLFVERVIGVGVLRDGRIGLEEACDNFFSVALTPDELRQLAVELNKVADLGECVERQCSGQPN